MAKITRKLMKIFGSGAGNQQRGVFGSLAAGAVAYSTDVETIQSLGEWTEGWFAAILGGNSPAIEDMNSMSYVYAYQLAYLMQQGIAEWNAETTYYIGSLVSDTSGNIYRSIADDNLNNATTDATKWAINRYVQSIDFVNSSISATVATNAMTIALKDAAGNNPSATSPSIIGFRSATAATGTASDILTTSSVSVVIPSATTIGTLSGVPQTLYVYAVNNAGTLVLAVSMHRFDEGSLQSSIAISGGASPTVLYSTSVFSSKAVRLIGRITSTQTAAGTWATAPSEVSTIPFSPTVFNSSAIGNTGNGLGSTNTSVRRYTNMTVVGTDITYTDSSSLGGSFTINTEGLYQCFATDNGTNAYALLGFTKNSATLNSFLSSVPVANRVTFSTVSNNSGTCPINTSGPVRCVPGDVLRVQTGTVAGGGDVNDTSNQVQMSIVRIG